MSVKQFVQIFELSAHPEGGYYRENYRSSSDIQTCCLGSEFPASRKVSTGIYYLINSDIYSGFHRIKSDELWHHYHGVTVNIHILKKNGTYECKKLGLFGDSTQPMQCVEKGDWFAATCAKPGFALMGCTVAPGFDFADFEMAKRKDLLKDYPEHGDIIARYSRD